MPGPGPTAAAVCAAVLAASCNCATPGPPSVGDSGDVLVDEADGFEPDAIDLPNDAAAESVDVASEADAVAIVQVAAGEQGAVSHSCAVRRGTVYCWGDNLYGQLGDGTGTRSNTPVAVLGISDAVQVSAGTVHTCAVLASGTVGCWGEGARGQLGDGTSPAAQYSPVPVSGLTDAVQIDSGGDHSCALRATGAVSCWGLALLGDGSPIA